MLMVQIAQTLEIVWPEQTALFLLTVAQRVVMPLIKTRHLAGYGGTHL
jgi:hypothetical protein